MNKGNEQLETIKSEILGILRERNLSARIILFGSRARGDFSSSSDWDFLLILEKSLPREEKIKVAHLVRKRLAEFHLSSDVMVRSEAEVEARKNLLGSVVRSAMEEGRQI